MQQDIELYINDQLVDLGDEQPPAYTLQVNTLGDLSSQQASYTKEISLPLTQRNRTIFGFPDDITLTTSAPYSQYPAKFVQGGVEIIPVGLAEIVNVENNKVNIHVLAGNVDFLDALGGEIADMGDSTTQWSGYGQNLVWNQYSLPFPDEPDNINNCYWSVKHAAMSQQKTSGWIFPLIDYGAVGPLSLDPASPNRINVRQQRPAFFVHTAVELLVQSTGYRIDYERSSLMRDPLYQKLLIPFSNSDFQHGSDYQNAPPIGGFSTTLGIQKVMPPGSASSGNIIFNPNAGFNGLSYTATENITGTVTLIFDFYMKGYATGKPSGVTININVRDPEPSTDNTNVGSQVINFDNNYSRLSGDGGNIQGEETFVNQKISADVSLTAGMIININFETDNSLNTLWVMQAGATLTFLPSEINVLFNQNIQCERILPDISQLDFLKDILQSFAVICMANMVTKKVVFAFFSDIVDNIPNALDWSNKCVDMGKQVYFQLGNYAQINWMRYQFDDNANLRLLLPEYFADDKIIIKDTTINPTTPVQVLFTSSFSPSPNRAYYGGTIAQILMIDTTSSPTDFSIGVQPRLMVDEKYYLKQQPNGGGEKVTFSDQDTADDNDITINDVISVPYFYKPGGEYNLCYCDKGGQPGLRSKYYPTVEKVLKNTKKVIRYFYLTPLDIANFDFLTPIYLRQDNAYFYVAQIDSWVKGQPCKVTLIRL